MDTAQIHTLLAPLGLWIGRVLACVALLAVEGPVLLFVAWVKARPWYERALAALPLAACVWAVVVLRHLQSAYDDWQSYLAFQASHYPAEFGKSVATWAGPEIAAAAQQGVSVAWVTGVLLVAGWAALAWWLLSGRTASESDGVEGAVEGAKEEVREEPV